MNPTLYKTRSAAACLKAAFTFVCDHAGLLIRTLWLPCLCYAVATTSSIMPATRAFSPLLTIPAAIYLYAVFYDLLNQRGMKGNAIKALKLVGIGALLVTAVTLLAGIILSPFMLVASLAPRLMLALTIVGGVIMLAGLVVGIPLELAITKYMMEDQPLLPSLRQGFRVGFRYWGFLFLTTMMIFLCTLIVFTILMMPVVVLTFAEGVSASGVAMGDPAGLPASFMWMYAATCVGTFFLLSLVAIWMSLATCYAYGSVEQQETEKKLS